MNVVQRKFKQLTVVTWLLLAAVIISPPAIGDPSAPADSDAGYSLPEGGPFTLESAKGLVSLSDSRGKLVMLFFGYTSCPDVCPTALSTWSMALKQLEQAELEQIQSLFISLDPNRDTPEKLATYTGYFHDKIIGLTGSKDAIDKVVDQYRVAYEVVEGTTSSGPLINHSAYTYVIDQNGQLLGLLKHGSSPTRIVEVVRKLLK